MRNMKTIKSLCRSPPSKEIWMGLTVLDHILSMCIIAPFVPTYWRGTWFLLGHYVFPERTDHHGWTTMSVGILGCIILYMLQNKLYEMFKNPSMLTWIFVYHIFIYIFSWCCIGKL